jgi:hypothetical protein
MSVVLLTSDAGRVDVVGLEEVEVLASFVAHGVLLVVRVRDPGW